MKKLELTCVVTKDNGEDYCSLCLELNVASQGSTVPEARRMLKEAVLLYVETSLEENLPIMRPVSPEDNPLISEKDKVKDVFKMVVSLKTKANAQITGLKAATGN